MRVHSGPLTPRLAAQLYADILCRTGQDWHGLPVLRLVLREALGLDGKGLAALEGRADALWERWLQTGRPPLPRPRRHPLP